MSDAFQTAVVTGASRGFGRAIAAALVAAGTPVVGISRITSFNDPSLVPAFGFATTLAHRPETTT